MFHDHPGKRHLDVTIVVVTFDGVKGRICRLAVPAPARSGVRALPFSKVTMGGAASPFAGPRGQSRRTTAETPPLLR